MFPTQTAASRKSASPDPDADLQQTDLFSPFDQTQRLIAAEYERRTKVNETDAQTLLAVARQYLERACGDGLPEHVALECAAIVASDPPLPERLRREALQLLEESRDR